MQRTIYVTTSIPYVNAKPHIGHALELVQADVIARYYRLTGARVVFQTGTDENAQKNVLAARALGVPVEALVEVNAEQFRSLTRLLEISADTFIRTTEPRHRRGVEELWRRLRPGDLYRRGYEGLYCTGCEDFLAEEELIDGCCPEHLVPPELVREENYFFRLSRYQEPLERLVASGAMRVVPQTRREEVLAFIRSGLHDISVSRDARRMSGWGIPVPGDPSQTVYVWVDALMNYVTGPGLGTNPEGETLWSDETIKIHVIGKNVWKFHAIIWPALLLSGGLPLPDELFVHGFITVEGRKMSKSLGNVVDPFGAAEALGAESLRHYLLSLSPFVDGDYSEEAHGRLHDARLANGIGNLVVRITTLCERAGVERLPAQGASEPPAGYTESMGSRRLDRVLDSLWGEVGAVNTEIDATRPWQSIRDPVTQEAIVSWAVRTRRLGRWLEPLLPTCAARIAEALAAVPIKKCAPLFRRAGATRRAPRRESGTSSGSAR